MQATRILAIRHGETDWNRVSRIQGQTDIALNDQGRWQAQRLGLALGSEPLAAVYSSDLGRALQTAQHLAEPHGLVVQTDPALRERCFGAYEGMTWSELEAAEPEAIRRWRQRDPAFAPPGGETLVQLQQRVVAALSRVAALHPGQLIAVVTHGGVLDSLYRAATRLALQAPRSWELPNTGVNRLLWSPEGLSLLAWADTQHLHSTDGTALEEQTV